jgi:hypothetical protein
MMGMVALFADLLIGSFSDRQTCCERQLETFLAELWPVVEDTPSTNPQNPRLAGVGARW